MTGDISNHVFDVYIKRHAMRKTPEQTSIEEEGLDASPQIRSILTRRVQASVKRQFSICGQMALPAVPFGLLRRHLWR